MGNLNKIQLIGHLGQEPDKKMTPNGTAVTTVSLAVTEKYTDKQGVKQESTEWFRCVFWGKLADLVGQYTRKGSQLYIEGSVKTREYTDKEGIKRWSTEINARNIQFLDKQGGQQQGGQQQQQAGNYQQNKGSQQGGYQQRQPPNQAGQSDDFIDDDIPF